MSRPLVSVAAMGGTIAMRHAGQGRPIGPALDAAALVASVPGLDAVARLRVRSLFAIGSPSMTFDRVLEALAWCAAEVDAGACGVVLTHGTDTLEETAYLLDLLWSRPEPLVVTGAMRPADAAGADGPANLLAAVTAAREPQLRGLGVLVVMADEIHLADRVTKTHTMAVGAFASTGGGPVGRVEEGRVVLDVLPAQARPGVLEVPTTGTAARVALVESGLGDDGSLVRLAVDAGYDGVVVAGSGAGHVPAVVADVLESVVGRVPVVVASRTGAGRTAARTYGYPGAEVDLLDRGVVLAGALSPRKARLLLWVLVRQAADRDQIEQEFAVRGRRLR